jgi:hypothetical protein
MKRAALNVDLKSSLTKVLDKKKDKDSKSAELSQLKEDVVCSSVIRKSTSNPIDQVGKQTVLLTPN